MARSLRGRLVVLLLLLIVAASAAAALMFGLFRQSAAAQAGQAQAEIGRACEAIQSAYHNFSEGRRGRSGGSKTDENSQQNLTALVQSVIEDPIRRRRRHSARRGIARSPTPSRPIRARAPRRTSR